LLLPVRLARRALLRGGFLALSGNGLSGPDGFRKDAWFLVSCPAPQGIRAPAGEASQLYGVAFTPTIWVETLLM